MPRKVTTSISIPKERPSTCSGCPFLAVRPKEELPHGCRFTHQCFMTWRYLSGRGTKTLRAHGRCTNREWTKARESMNGQFVVGIPMARQYGIKLPGDEQLTIQFES